MTYRTKVIKLETPLKNSFPNCEWEWNEETLSWIETSGYFKRYWIRILRYTGYVPYVFLRALIRENVRTETIVVDWIGDKFMVTID